MQRSVQLIEYLSSFTNLSPAFIKYLQDHQSFVSLDKGDIYVSKDAHTKKVSFLAEGIMRIYDIDAEGQEWNKVILTPPTLVIGNVNFREKSIHHPTVHGKAQ